MILTEPATARTYAAEEIETALCVWEELDRRSQPQNSERYPGPYHWRQEYGTWAMRHATISLAQYIESLFGALPVEAWDGLSFDWEIVPAALDFIDWSVETPLPVLATTPESAARFCRWVREGAPESASPAGTDS